MNTGFVLALEYTAVGNAVILSNSQAIMLLVAKFFVGEPVSLMEGSGALLAFTGAILCSKDSADQQQKQQAQMVNDATQHDNYHNGTGTGWITLLGDVFGLLSGIGGCGYLIRAKRIRKYFGLYIFMFLNMFIGSLFVMFLMAFVFDETFELTRNERIGVWGWINFEFDRLPLEMIAVVVWYVGISNFLL